MVDEDRGRLAWQRLLKPFAVVVACNWVAFIATNEVLTYCSLCQLWIQANFGCCCCRFSSFSLRPSIDVAPDGHVGRWTSSPLLHAVEAPGTFLWHFLGTSGIHVNADQITKWSMMIRARTSASSSAMHEGVFSRLWWKSSVSGARGHRRLCHFSCSVKVNFNRHNLAKLRKKKSYYFHKPPVRRRLGWQPVNDHRSVCAKRWLLQREDVTKCAANLIAICTVVLRQTWQYGVNRRCVPPFFFVHYPLVIVQHDNHSVHQLKFVFPQSFGKGLLAFIKYQWISAWWRRGEPGRYVMENQTSAGILTTVAEWLSFWNGQTHYAKLFPIHSTAQMGAFQGCVLLPVFFNICFQPLLNSLHHRATCSRA